MVLHLSPAPATTSTTTIPPTAPSTIMFPTVARTGLRAAARQPQRFALQRQQQLISKRGYASDREGHQSGKSKLVSLTDGYRGGCPADSLDGWEKMESARLWAGELSERDRQERSAAS